mmetsp:Transcript_73350/g.122536  ORF Transcript_73350/g.122536 Transcript_73350/m.122536 type:complete len:221 (+) Transcript_73350:82-744(+)
MEGGLHHAVAGAAAASRASVCEADRLFDREAERLLDHDIVDSLISKHKLCSNIQSKWGRAAATIRHLGVASPITVPTTPSSQEISNMENEQAGENGINDVVFDASNTGECDMNISGLYQFSESRPSRRNSREFLMDEPERLSRVPSADFLTDEPDDNVFVFDARGTCVSVFSGGEEIRLGKDDDANSGTIECVVASSNPLDCFANIVQALLWCRLPTITA